jgi:hypothetical protein
VYRLLPCVSHLTKFHLCVVLLEAPENAHFSHFVWMLLLFPHAEQTWQFILLAKEFGQWCRLASSGPNIINDRAGGRPNCHIPACSSSLLARARWKSQCDSFAPHRKTAGWNCSESSDPVNGRRVSLFISRSKLFVILSPMSTYHTHKTECTLDLGHNCSGCLGPY